MKAEGRRQKAEGGRRGEPLCAPAEANRPPILNSQFSTLNWPFPLLTSHFSHRGLRPRRGFTLIELMIVIVIILMAATLAAPVIGGSLTSNQMTEAITKMGSLVTIAQSYAQVQGEAGLLVERAYLTDGKGIMIDTMGRRICDSGFTEPVWQPYQWVRLVRYGYDSTAHDYVYRVVQGRPPVVLPKGIFMAPYYARDPLLPVNNTGGTTNLNPERADLPNSWYTPSTGAPFDRLQTFLLLFDQQGMIMLKRASATPTGTLYYLDPGLPTLDSKGNLVSSLEVTHPDDSALGVLLYDRQKFESAPNRMDFLARDTRPLYINRFTGAVVEGRSQ